MFKFSYLKIWIFISSPVMTCSEAVWLPWVPFNFSSTRELSGFCGCHLVSDQTISSADQWGHPHHIMTLPSSSFLATSHPLILRWTKRCLGNLSLKISDVWPPWSSWLWHFLWFLRGLLPLILISHLTIWYHQLKPKPRELVSILDLGMLWE